MPSRFGVFALAGLLAGTSALGAAGCGDDASVEPAPTERTTTAPAPGEGDPPTPPGPEDTADPLAGMDDLPTPSEYAAPTGVDLGARQVPAGACVALTDLAQRVWDAPGVPAIAVAGERFHVAIHSRGGGATDAGGADALHLVSVSPEAEPTPTRTIRITPPHAAARTAPPALAVDGELLALAFIDGQGHVRLGSIDPGAPSANLRTIEAGSGADLRFAPALAVVGDRRVVAWTDGTATPMRVRVARADRSGVLLDTRDVTMRGMGAAAPVFAAGASPTTLYFVDPRAGISPIIKAVLDPDGVPLPSAVARPVGTVSVPPELAVAVDGEGNAFAGYTAIGNMATTAVGMMPLFGEVATPVALVPGIGYGPLNVAATAGSEAVVFAADAPQDQPPEAEREIHLRVVRGGTPGPVLTLTGPDGTGRQVAIARRSDGILGVAFSTGDGVFVAWARCDD